MADNLKNKQELIKAQERYQTLLNMQEKSGKDYSASLEKQKQKVLAIAKELKKANQERLDQYKSEESQIKSISGAFKAFQDAQKNSLSIAASANLETKEQVKTVTDVLSTTRDIANISKEDEFARIALTNQYKDQLGKAKLMFGEESEIVKAMEAQYQEAVNISHMSEEQRKVLQAQHTAAEKVKTTLQGISETIQTAASKLLSVKGAMGGLLYASGAFLEKLGAVNKELGQVGDFTNGAANKAALMSFFFADAAGNLKALSAEMGGMEQATFGNQLNINMMANNLGVSGGEAVKLQGALARLNGGSLDTAANLTAGAQEFAKMNNIPVSQLMGDVAASTEEFALFGKDGGKNILQAAGAAAKLGTSMSTLSGVADNLLDFETSITKELELSAMLGKNINLNRARGLAYEGDIQGAVNETLNQLGGIDAFNKMDYFQKKQTAALLGVSVGELQKMATNQENLAKMSNMTSGSWSNLTEGLKAAASQFLPKLAKGAGSFLMLSSQAGNTWNAFGGKITEGAKSLGKMVGFGKKAAETAKSASAMGDAAKNATTATSAASRTPRGGAGGLKGLAQGLKAMGNPKVLFGALNLIPTSVGFLAILPGIPGMLGVSLLGAGAGAGLKGLGQGLKAMGSVKALLGTAVLAAAGLGFLLSTIGLPGMIGISLLGIPTGTGLTAIGVGLNALSTALPGAAALAVAALGFTLMTLGIPGMLGISLLAGPTSAGLTTLAVGLTSFGAAAMNPLLWLGIGAIGALGLALLPTAFALNLAAPAISAFGDVVLAAFNGLATVVTAVSQGLVSIIEVITPEKALAMIGLGAGFLTLSAGIVALSASALLGGVVIRRFLRKTGESIGAIGESGVQNVQNLATALQGMAMGLTAVVTQLDRLDTEKLEKLSEVSISASIGGAISGIGDSIGGLIDSVSGVVGGDSLSEYETSMLEKIDQLITATNTHKDVYLDKDKVTNLVMAKAERTIKNNTNINNS